jgi:gluconolactonase
MIALTALLVALAQTAPTAPSQTAPGKPAAPSPAPVPPAANAGTPKIAASGAPVADAQGRPGIAGLAAADARPDLIIRGIQFAEGPATDSMGETYFCDLGGVRVYRVVRSAQGVRADIVCDDTRGIAGLAFSRDGHLYGTQMWSGRIVEVVLASDGTGRLRGVVESYHGEPRSGVNDLVTTADGGIWFSLMADARHAKDWNGVYYTTGAGAEPIRVNVPVDRPNGVRLSPDGHTLYVVDFANPRIWAFPVEGPGKLGEGRVFAELAVLGGEVSGGDGLAVDAKGNVWAAVPDASAVIVFDPQGKPLGRVMLPEHPSNCAFGGTDGRSLFIAARTGIYVLPTLVDGFWTARGGSPAVTVPVSQLPASAPPPAAAPK